jgi:hypothetical protein
MSALENLFVELVKIELSNYKSLSKNMVSNTIKHFAGFAPFSTVSIEQWHCVCSASGVKYDI